MKTIPLTQKHIASGAKMADFAGFNMPISYSSIKEEHLAVRNNAGVFDVSHMGEFSVKGRNALDFIQRITSNDLSKADTGNAQYSLLLNEEGGIIDDLVIYCLEKGQDYLLVVNAANIEKDFKWISGQNQEGVLFKNISEKTGLLAIQGPNANEIIQTLTSVHLKELKPFTFKKDHFAGVAEVMISATGYTGSGGVELYFDTKENASEKIWEALFETGSPQGLKPAGLGARDTLRLEKGYRLYGSDMDDFTNPYEAGLGWVVKLQKGDFIGKKALIEAKNKGIRKKLTGLTMKDRGIPRPSYLLKDSQGEEIGKITSGTMSPSLGEGIALGYVKSRFSAPGTVVYVEIRKKLLEMEVTKLPFI